MRSGERQHGRAGACASGLRLAVGRAVKKGGGAFPKRWLKGMDVTRTCGRREAVCCAGMVDEGAVHAER